MAGVGIADRCRGRLHAASRDGHAALRRAAVRPRDARRGRGLPARAPRRWPATSRRGARPASIRWWCCARSTSKRRRQHRRPATRYFLDELASKAQYATGLFPGRWLRQFRQEVAMRRLSVVCALVLVVPLIARAQDPLKVDPKHYRVIIDNEKVRVLRPRSGRVRSRRCTSTRTPSSFHWGTGRGASPAKTANPWIANEVGDADLEPGWQARQRELRGRRAPTWSSSS